MSAVATSAGVFLPHVSSDVLLAKSVRGTVIHGSLSSLRKRGYAERYQLLLDPRHRQAIAELAAASWLPIEVAIAHYRACDALNLGRVTIEEIGRETGLFVNQVVLSLVSRVSREAGATPWLPLSQAHKFLSRTWVGSSIAVYEIGPKEARLEWVQLPIATIPYARVAIGGFLGGIGGLFTTAMYVKDLAPTTTRPILTYNMSWV